MALIGNKIHCGKVEKIMNVTNAEFEYMKEYISKNLVSLLMTESGMDMKRALDTLYGSETFSKLSDPESGLFFQSPRYVFSYLKDELNQKDSKAFADALPQK